MPPARFCAAGPALINRKRHKTPPPFPQPKQECKPRFTCHKALNFPSTIFQSNFSTPTPGQNALSAQHLLQPVLSQRLKRTENPSQHLLHPISALLFDEKHKLCPVPSIIHPSSKIPPETKTLLTTISTPARRWHVARAVLFYFSLMRNANSILLSRGYRGGQRPRRTLKGGQGGTIVGSPCFFRFLSSEKGRNKKTTFILVQTHLETDSLLSTFLKNILL